MTRLPSSQAYEAWAHWYRPEPKIRVGILLVAGALGTRLAEVDAALEAAGHAPLRRRAELLTRVGEDSLRPDDVVEFLDLYGHEYALVVVRSWPAVRSHEARVVTAAQRAGCRVVWEVAGGDDVTALIAAHVDGLLGGDISSSNR